MPESFVKNEESVPDSTPEIYRVDDLTVDLASRKIRRQGSSIELPCLSFDLLAVLVRAAPAALSEDDLCRAVWKSNVVSDETLKQRVSLLRRALGDGEKGRHYIDTVRGYGYRLNPTPEAVKREQHHHPKKRMEPWQRVLFWLLVILLLLVIGLLSTSFKRVKRSERDAPEPVDISTRAGLESLGQP